jgi:WD40 repeat protein
MIMIITITIIIIIMQHTAPHHRFPRFGSPCRGSEARDDHPRQGERGGLVISSILEGIGADHFSQMWKCAPLSASVPVSLIRPQTGALMRFLIVCSAGLDGKVKIWEAYEERRVKRTYSGHSGAVRCINFNNDGSR